MISEILLKFGSSPGGPPISILASPVTVFVGPNNSGKSKILTELELYCSSGQANVTNRLITSLRFIELNDKIAKESIERLRVQPNEGETLAPDQIIFESRQGRQTTSYSTLLQGLQHPDRNPAIFASWFLRHLVLKLDGPNRVGLVGPRPAGDLQRYPGSALAVLFGNDPKRAEVRRILHEAFGTYFVIDPTQLGTLRVRFSDREPKDDMEERNIHAAGVAFHSQATPIDFASDGVKAFTGIIVELIAGDPRILLIDEPEAFLHPSLASKLGYEISRAAVQSDKRVFASTHSPSFVMGCIQSGAPINIVRLTYRAGVATSRILPNADILELMRNPLLRSTGVLNGLFYEFVVITESDTDRAFYQEINERLLRFKPEWGIPNCLFLNAQGKHTIHTLVAPLRKLGIPTAGIVDVDVLKEGGTQWAKILESAYIPEANHGALATLRAKIKATMDATGKDMKRAGGIDILQPGDKEAAENLIAQLANYGIFVVAKGELESWLKSAGATGHGPSWLIDVFTYMGEDPDSRAYAKPMDGDVWKFISEVKRWLVMPDRRGIPT